MNLRKLSGCLTAVLICTASAWGATANWPQFRGPDASGVAEGATAPAEWSETQNVRWTRDVPGRGWSSPIVWGNRVFLTAVVNHGQSEEIKRGLYLGGERPNPSSAVHEWLVYCLNLDDGEVVWKVCVHEGVPQGTVHLKNSYASETPVTDGERLYCYFGNVGIFCFDMEGQAVWTKKLPTANTANNWGTGASPTLFENRLFVPVDNAEESYLVALDSRSGDEVWRVERGRQSNWATPFVWRSDQRTELVALSSGLAEGLDLDGHQLWRFGGMPGNTISTPFSSHGLLILAAGPPIERVRPLLAIRPGASSDVSLAPDQTANQYVVWYQKFAGSYNTSPIVYGDNLYVLYDGGALACFDARSGKEIYKKTRLPNGRAFTASPWAYDGKLFCLSEYGDTFVIQAGPEFKLLHVNHLEGEPLCMATPAIAGDKLLIRTDAKVYCIAR